MDTVIVTRYEYDKRAVPGVNFDKKDPLSRSKTLQSGKDEADINMIMARYEKTGMLGGPLDNLSERMPHFGDFSDIGDFHAVMCKLTSAQQNFMLLPASVRNKFDNDVAKCLDFIADPKNYSEAVKLGMIPVDPVKEKALADAAALANTAVIDAAKAAAGASKGPEGGSPDSPDNGGGGT